MFKKTLDQTGKQALDLFKNAKPACGSTSGSMSVSSAGALVVGLSTGVLTYLAAKTCAARGGCFEDQVHDRYGRSLATPHMNVVDTSSEDSFPASDPPSFNAPSATPTQHE